MQQKAKGRRNTSPVLLPPTKEMEADFDLCGGIYPKGARHKGLLCEPEGRELLPALALCIRRLYVKHRHTHTTSAADNALRHCVRALHVQATHAPAACERRALDGVAAFCGAMKREVVKRLRQRRRHTWIRR